MNLANVFLAVDIYITYVVYYETSIAMTYIAACVLMHEWIGAGSNLLQCFSHNWWWRVIGKAVTKTESFRLRCELSKLNPSQHIIN